MVIFTKAIAVEYLGVKVLLESVQEKMDRGTDEPPHEEAVSQI